MKTTFTTIFLAALAATSSFASFLESDKDVDISSLIRASHNKGRLQLTDNGDMIQSVDSEGNVLDQIEITSEQSAMLQSKHEAALQRAKNQPQGSSENKRDVLETRQACADWASICEEQPDCFVYNCDDCFAFHGIGACYSYF